MCFIHVKAVEHTRLCRWMVYSRATTSEMAERVFFGAVVFLVCALSLAILSVLVTRIQLLAFVLAFRSLQI